MVPYSLCGGGQGRHGCQAKVAHLSDDNVFIPEWWMQADPQTMLIKNEEQKKKKTKKKKKRERENDERQGKVRDRVRDKVSERDRRTMWGRDGKAE